jgi:CxxC-x17-CxxC domain-containing protein
LDPYDFFVTALDNAFYLNFLLKKENSLVLIVVKSWKIMSEERKMFPMKCSDCGTDSEVPFEPKPDRPVYCRECLPKHRSGGKQF